MITNNSNKNTEDITAIILTYNEEKHIKRCILSIKKITKEIIVIDSYSNDKTLALCKKQNIQVFTNSYKNHAQQLNWALKNINLKTKWIIRIDADEILENNFKKKFFQIKDINNYNALNILIEHNFLGNRIKHGGVYPQYQIRIWKRNEGIYDNKPMDEKLILTNPKIYTSDLRIIDYNLKGFYFWLKKHQLYANREANLYLLLKKKTLKIKNFDKKLKEKIFYYKFPIFLRPFLLFFYRYIIKKGFLDGFVGIKFNILQTLYYRFLVDCFILTKIVLNNKK